MVCSDADRLHTLLKQVYLDSHPSSTLTCHCFQVQAFPGASPQLQKVQKQAEDMINEDREALQKAYDKKESEPPHHCLHHDHTHPLCTGAALKEALLNASRSMLKTERLMANSQRLLAVIAALEQASEQTKPGESSVIMNPRLLVSLLVSPSPVKCR